MNVNNYMKHFFASSIHSSKYMFHIFTFSYHQFLKKLAPSTTLLPGHSCFHRPLSVLTGKNINILSQNSVLSTSILDLCKLIVNKNHH